MRQLTLCWIVPALALVGTGCTRPVDPDAGQAAHPGPNLSMDPPRTFYVIRLESILDDKAVTDVGAGIAAARRAEVDGVLIYLDSPGGGLDAAQKITDALAEQLDGIPTFAYVPNAAYAAAAHVALGCDEIVLAPDAKIGRLEPIFIGPGGRIQEIPEKIRGKIIFAILSTVRRLCKDNGHHFLLAQAMVDPSLEIYAAINARTHQVRPFCPQVADPAMLPEQTRRTGIQRDRRGWPVLADPWRIDAQLSDGQTPLVLTATEAVMFAFARSEETLVAAGGGNLRLIGNVETPSTDPAFRPGDDL